MKRVDKLLELLTDEEKTQFLNAVKNDFACQWNGNWDTKGVFTELYKKLVTKACDYCNRYRKKLYKYEKEGYVCKECYNLLKEQDKRR